MIRHSLWEPSALYQVAPKVTLRVEFSQLASDQDLVGMISLVVRHVIVECFVMRECGPVVRPIGAMVVREYRSNRFWP